jgi:hypothetical protein
MCHHRHFGEWRLARKNLGLSGLVSLATWDHAMKTIRRFDDRIGRGAGALFVLDGS